MEYRISWEIDVDATSPEDAARKARAIQLDPESVADVFDVRSSGGAIVSVDLSIIDGRSVD